MPEIKYAQDSYLERLRSSRTLITVYTINGFQLKGIIVGFDNFCIWVETVERVNMVYKHAISTIAPTTH